MRISYCTWGMKNVSIDELVPAVAAMGYHGIELAVTPGWPTELATLDVAKRKQISQLVDDHGLVISAVAGHTAICEIDPEANEPAMQQLRDTIDLAAELRQEGEPPIVASLLGGHEDDWGKVKNLVAERVRVLGEYAATKDVIFAVEPHSGMSFDLPRKALWLMEQVDHPNVRLNFDISHFDIRGIPIDECVPQMVPWSAHTHVKDQCGIYPNHDFLTPGSGPFDMVHYVKAMYDAGYDGWIGMEVSVRVQRRAGYDPFVDANLGYYALVHACNAAGVPLAPRPA